MFRFQSTSADGHTIIQTDNEILIANITRKDMAGGVVEFSTTLEDLILDQQYNLTLTPIRERCGWSVSQYAYFKTTSVVGE